jgi:hypothetical protein
MPAGALQLGLTAYPETFLFSNPQITFYKQVYKRHTNFAVEPISQFFNVKPDFGSRVTCTISKIADLIGKIYLVVNLPPIGKFIDFPGEEGQGNSNIASCAWCKKIGWNLIKQVELEIGGSIIERQYGDWLNIYSELTTPISKRRGLDKMIGNIPEIYENTNGKKGYLLLSEIKNNVFTFAYERNNSVCDEDRGLFLWRLVSDTTKNVIIESDRVFIYSSPNIPTKMYLKKFDCVEVISEKNNWLHIKYYGKKIVEGWIRKKDTELK